MAPPTIAKTISGEDQPTTLPRMSPQTIPKRPMP
jgi:hypothetical protein